MSRLFVVLLACSTAFMGCIIRDFDYDPPANVPPSVQSWPTARHPLNQVLDIDLSAPPGGDGGVSNDIRFEAEVRDANVGQVLEGRVYVDNTLTQGIAIPPALDSEDPLRRRVEFTITRTGLGHGCHLVQLLVSSENGFELHPSREPRTRGDIGSASWWIAAHQTPDEPVQMDGCPEGQ